MAKEKDAKVVSRTEVPPDILKELPASDGSMLVVWQDTFKQDGKESPFWYVAPPTPEAFKRWVPTLTEKALESAYDFLMYAADLKGRASARENIAAESTKISRNGKIIDVMDLPIERAVGGINSAYSQVAELGGEVQKALIIARRKLIEQGKAFEKDGLLLVKK